MRSLLLALLGGSAAAYSNLHAAAKSPSAAAAATLSAPAPVCPDSDAVASRLDVAAPPRAEPKLGDAAVPKPLDLWPQPKLDGPRGPSVFKLNQGRAIDVLRHDYPRLFTEKPDLSIFAENVELHDPSGKRLEGKKQYDRVFYALRFLRRTTMQDAQVTHRVVADDSTIRIRWSAKLWMRDPALGINKLVNGEPALVHIDGVSVYELNTDGLIRRHRLENIVLTGKEEGAPSVQLAFAWPNTGFATPELALPFFSSLQHALGGLRQAPGGRAAPRARRSSDVVASASEGAETPMERAARERREDEEKRQRLAALRAPKEEKQQGGGLFGLTAPQACETSYDCERPMVCCDLLFASVCCTGGILIPTTDGMSGQGVLQRQAIPIPVERDRPAGGDAPRYPD